MRNKAAILFLSGIFLSTKVSAVDGISSFKMDWTIIERAFKFLFDLLQNHPTIRQGLALILLFVLLYNILMAIIKRISLFSEHGGQIAFALSGLSVAALFAFVGIQKIEKLFLLFVVGLIIIFIIRGLIWLKSKISAGTNHRRVERDERREAGIRNDERRGDNVIDRIEDQIVHGTKEVCSKIKESMTGTGNAYDELRKLEESVNRLKIIHETARRRGGI